MISEHAIDELDLREYNEVTPKLPWAHYRRWPNTACIVWKDGDQVEELHLNERVVAVAPLMDAVFKHHCEGGMLHVAIADGNMGDDTLVFCRGEIDAATPGDDSDPPYSERQREAERACLAALEALSEPERLAAYYLHLGHKALVELVEALDLEADGGPVEVRTNRAQ